MNPIFTTATLATTAATTVATKAATTAATTAPTKSPTTGAGATGRGAAASGATLHLELAGRPPPGVHAGTLTRNAATGRIVFQAKHLQIVVPASLAGHVTLPVSAVARITPPRGGERAVAEIEIIRGGGATATRAAAHDAAGPPARPSAAATTSPAPAGTTPAARHLAAPAPAGSARAETGAASRSTALTPATEQPRSRGPLPAAREPGSAPSPGAPRRAPTASVPPRPMPDAATPRPAGTALPVSPPVADAAADAAPDPTAVGAPSSRSALAGSTVAGTRPPAPGLPAGFPSGVTTAPAAPSAEAPSAAGAAGPPVARDGPAATPPPPSLGEAASPRFAAVDWQAIRPTAATTAAPDAAAPGAPTPRATTDAVRRPLPPVAAAPFAPAPVERSPPAPLPAQIAADLAALAGLERDPPASARGVRVPVLHDGLPLALPGAAMPLAGGRELVAAVGEEDPTAAAGPPHRLVLEVDLPHLGRIRLDGLADGGRFDVLMAPVPEALRPGLRALWSLVAQRTGLEGDLGFLDRPEGQK